MKYPAFLFVILLAALCGSPARAALIIYSYDSPIYNANGFYQASATITVDDQSRSLVAVDFSSDPFTFFWQGAAGLIHDQPVSATGGLYQNGFSSIFSGDITFNLYLDIFYLEAGEDLFHNLHKTHPYEGAFISSTSFGETLWLSGTLTKLDTIEVPEPASALLFALGLLLILRKATATAVIAAQQP